MYDIYPPDSLGISARYKSEQYFNEVEDYRMLRQCKVESKHESQQIMRRLILKVKMVNLGLVLILKCQDHHHWPEIAHKWSGGLEDD